MVDIKELLLPGMLILGLITSYSDIRYGKIRNKWILFGLVYFILINIIVIFYFDILVEENRAIYTAVNFAFSLSLGFLIWHLRLWTAGDGKLFTVFAILTPVNVYTNNNLDGFFSINLLFNTFIPLFLFFTLYILFKTPYRQKKGLFLKAFDFKQTILTLLIVFNISWIVEYILDYLNIRLNTIEIFFVILILLYLYDRFIKLKEITLINRFKLVFLMVLALIGFIVNKSIYSLRFFEIFILLTLLLIILKSFIFNLSFNCLTRDIKMQYLKEGMIPAEIIYKDKEKYRKKNVAGDLFSFFIERKKGIFKLEPEGLREEDIKKLKIMAKNNTQLKYFRVQETIPFAPFLFLGTIMTWIASGNFLVFLVEYAAKFI